MKSNIANQPRPVRVKQPIIFVLEKGGVRAVGTRAMAISSLMERGIKPIFTSNHFEATHIIVSFEAEVAQFIPSINIFQPEKKILCMNEGELQNPSPTVVHVPIRHGMEKLAEELLTLPLAA